MSQAPLDYVSLDACACAIGEHGQPLCFVMEASNTAPLVAMHKQLVTAVVRPGDVFINIFPKHQEEIEVHGYPGEVESILDYDEFRKRVCSCRAIISSRLHGAILSLHTGVPTFGAFYAASEYKLPELMRDVMRMPDQFFVIDESLNRSVVDGKVEALRREYADGGRRASIYALVSEFYDEFMSRASHVLFDIIGVRPTVVSEAETTELATSKASTSDGEGVSSHTAVVRVVERAREEGVDTAAADGVSADQSDVLKGLTAGEGVAEETGKAISETGPVALKTWAAEMEASEGPTGPDGPVIKIAHGKPDMESISLNTTLRHRVDANSPSSDGGSITDALVVNDYVAAIFLLACIFAIAFLPLGGTLQRDSHENLAEQTAVVEEGGPAHVQKEMVISERRIGVSEASTVSLAPPAAPGFAATSSKMLFMLNFTMWVTLAMGFSVYGKYYLRDTRDPVGLVVLEGATGVVVLCALGQFGARDLHPWNGIPPDAYRQAGLVAMLHTGQTLLTNFAVLVGGMAITNALKAMEPFAVAVLSYLLLGKRSSGSTVAAIGTIVAGMVLLTSKSYGGGGGARTVLISAAITLPAVCCNALRNVLIKQGDPISPHQTLFACSAAATYVGIGIMLLMFMVRAALSVVTGDEAAGSGGGNGGWFRVSGVNAALCLVGYNFASFNLLARLNPVGHAVANSCKRMLVFESGLLFLGAVMSVRQLGAALALVGVVAYNVAGAR